MKNLLVILFILGSITYVSGQVSTKFEPGFFIDKFNEKYEGELMLQPGDGTKPGALIFRESKKGNKESYGPDYVKTFVIASDTFAVIEKIPLSRGKTVAEDFAKVLMTSKQGTLYLHELAVLTKSGHASSAHMVTDEKLRYIIKSPSKLTVLNKGNLKEFASMIPDHPALQKRVLAKKVKLEEIRSAVDEYKKFKIEKSLPKQ